MTDKHEMRSTYAEYLAGRASLDDLEKAADRVMSRFQAEQDAARRSAADKPSAPRTTRGSRRPR